MEVGVEYDSFPMSCEECWYVWMCMVYIDVIDWGNGEVEYIYHVSGVCPECGHENKIQIDI